MAWAGLRLAITLLTVIPLPAPRGRRPGDDAGPDDTDLRPVAGAAMCWAPAVGLLLGGAAAAVLWAAAGPGRTGPLLAAVLAIAALAGLTGGLHLDGLADLADGLGSRRPAAAALEVMKKSDIGPFGVLALVLTLLVQVAALAQAQAAGRGIAAVLTAAVTARLAMAGACQRGIPAARGSGLGALVAGSVHPAAAAGLAAVTLGGAAAAGVRYAIAAAVGLAVAAGLTALAVRRLGGITGDVLGAIAEVTAAACLIAIAIR